LILSTLKIARNPVETDKCYTAGGRTLLSSNWLKTIELLMMYAHYEQAHCHSEGLNHFWLIPASHETLFDTIELQYKILKSPFVLDSGVARNFLCGRGRFRKFITYIFNLITIILTAICIDLGIFNSG
jgi:hypothetical protein